MADAETAAPGEPLSKNEQKRQQKVCFHMCIGWGKFPTALRCFFYTYQYVPPFQLAKKAAEKAEKDKAKAEAAAANPDVKAKPKKVSQSFIHFLISTPFTLFRWTRRISARMSTSRSDLEQ